MSNQAPITQLLLTVQFPSVAASLTVLDWADLRRLFATDFPVFTQVPRAGPMPFRADQFIFEQPTGIPRLHMASADLASIIMVQDDRISFGWIRTAPLTMEPDYPGFQATLARGLAIFDQIISFVNERSIEKVKFIGGELFYVDAFIIATNGVVVRNLEEVFASVKSHKAFTFNGFTHTYQRMINIAEGGQFDGYVETTLSGFAPTSDDHLTTGLQTTIRFGIEPDDSSLASLYEAAHDISQTIFATLVKPTSYTILDAS